jgi:hypothetical protein
VVLESNVTSRRRFACLFPVVIFIALRALSHAHPAPFPGTSGVFDGEGLDDILQLVRVAYAKSADGRDVTPRLLSIPTGRASVSEPSLARGPIVGGTHSRAPPTC